MLLIAAIDTGVELQPHLKNLLNRRKIRESEHLLLQQASAFDEILPPRPFSAILLKRALVEDVGVPAVGFYNIHSLSVNRLHQRL